MILTEQDNGRTIEVGADAVVTLRLNENATTGYRWTVESAGGLEPVDDSFEGATEAMGSGGVRVLKFRSSSPGSHKLRLKNRREWEGDSSIIERFEATIKAK